MALPQAPWNILGQLRSPLCALPCPELLLAVLISYISYILHQGASPCPRVSLRAGDHLKGMGEGDSLLFCHFPQPPRSYSSLPRDCRRCVDLRTVLHNLHKHSARVSECTARGLEPWRWEDAVHWLPCLLSFKGLLIFSPLTLHLGHFWFAVITWGAVWW